MLRMLVNGFGCSTFLLFFSFAAIASEPIDSKISGQEKDTTIAVVDVVEELEALSADNTISSVVITENAEKISKPAEKSIKTVVTTDALYSQLHPLSVSFVKEYNRKNERRFENILEKNARHFTLIDGILEKNNLPLDLKYLAIIESDLKNGAISNKGAVGPWQFMAPTARLMGLTVNKHRDERRDLTKSTQAAAKYLKVLYSQFNDWYLTVAAYNCGASRVEYAIRKSGSRDFWKLQHHLPAESRGHVKKFIATRYYFDSKVAEENNPLSLNVERLSRVIDADGTSSVVVSGKYRSAALMKILDMEANVFDNYNPGFDAEVSGNGYQLRLPNDKMEIFSARKHEILAESIQMMLNENSSIISSDSKKEYPRAIELSKPKAVAADNSTARKKK